MHGVPCQVYAKGSSVKPLCLTKAMQEIKLPNEQLMNFLLLDETLGELMHHVVATPDLDIEGDAKFNLPSAACEVICCEVSSSCTAVAGILPSSETLLGVLQLPSVRLE